MNGVSPFFWALPANEKIAPSSFTSAPWPSGFASRCPHGRGVSPWILSSVPSAEKSNGSPSDGLRRESSSVRRREKARRSDAGSGTGMPRWRAISAGACARVLAPAVDEYDLCAAARREIDLDPQARAGIEAVEQTLVVRRARAAFRERTRQAQAAAAHEGQARVLVAGQAHARLAAGADGMDTRPARSARARRAAPVLGQDRAQRRHEAGAHVEGREKRMPAVGALDVERQLLVAGDLEPCADAPSDSRSRIRQISTGSEASISTSPSARTPPKAFTIRSRRRRSLRDLVVGAHALARPRAERPDRAQRPRLRGSASLR